MAQGRLLIPLLVFAAVINRSASQAAAPAADQCDPCSPPCAPASRVRVIVPPPEVVFCSPEKKGHRLFHHKQPCAPPCEAPAPCAPTPPAAPASGQMSFNMNLAVPYMTYQMTPMMTGAAGFGGLGMMGGTFGTPFAAPTGGIGLGLGGGLPLGLGGNPLAALGLGAPGGIAGFGTSGLEVQLLRALLGRAAGNGTDPNRPAAGAAEDDAAAQMRSLRAGIADLTARIQNELAGVRQMREEMTQNTQAIPLLAGQIKELRTRIEAVEKKQKGME